MRLQARLALTLAVFAVPLGLAASWVRKRIEFETRAEGVRDFVRWRADSLGREACESDPVRLRQWWRPPGPSSRRGLKPREASATSSPGEVEAEGGEPPAAVGKAGASPAAESPPGASPTAPGEGRGERRFGYPRTGSYGAWPGFGPSPSPGASPPGRRRGRESRQPWGPSSFGFLYAYDGKFTSRDPDAPTFPATLRRKLERGASWTAEPEGPGVLLGMRSGWDEGDCAYILTRRPEPSPYPRTPGLGWIGGGLIGAMLLVALAGAAPVVGRIRRLTEEVRAAAASRYARPISGTGADEIGDLARAFNEAGSEIRAHIASLESRDRALREFLANTTHDVMVPLTVLQGHLSEVERAGREGRPADPARLTAALEEAHYIASLVHNLGAAARLEAAEPEIVKHRVDLNAVVERVVGRHAPFARLRNVSLEHAVPEERVEVLGDVTLLEQAVSNVVHNAIRHNREGGHAAIVLEGVDAWRFRLRVLDDGPGVREEVLGKLGQTGYRSPEARTRHPEGLGLGLHIAGRAAERHGFTLDFARSEHGGLEVTLSGPRAGPA